MTPRFHHPNRLSQIREFANREKSIGLVKPPQSTSDLRSEVEVAIAALQIFSLRLRPAACFFTQFGESTPTSTSFARSPCSQSPPQARDSDGDRSADRTIAMRSEDLLYDRMVSELDEKKTRNLGFRRRFRPRSFVVNRNYQRDSALCFACERKNFRMCWKESQKIGGTSIIYTFCILFRSSNYFLRMIR